MKKTLRDFFLFNLNWDLKDDDKFIIDIVFY